MKKTQGNPQQGSSNTGYRLQRLSERGAEKRKRQSGLHRNMQKTAEMPVSAKRAYELIDDLHWGEERLSLREICRREGIKYAKLYWYVRKYKIPVMDRVDSLKRSYPKGANWKGGRTVFKTPTKNGSRYVQLFMPGHPNANQNYVLEHRYVMAKAIDRPLRKDEVVHHVNGNASDNRIENLEIRKRGGSGYYHGPLTVCPHCKKDLPS